MITKMRRKLILVTASVIFAILMVVVLLNTFADYQQLYSSMSQAMDYILENEGGTGDKDFSMRDIFGSQLGKDYLHSISYFTILSDKEGQASGLDTEHIDTISDDTAQQLSEQVLLEDEDHGRERYGRRVYLWKKAPEGGGTRLVVVDITYNISSLRENFVFSVLMSVFGVAAFCFVLRIFYKRALAPFIRNMETQRQFITNAGHELKTPVAIINANAEALEMIEGENEFTTNIQHQSARLAQLIDNLIALARHSEQENVVLTDVDCTELAKEAEESFRTLAENAGKGFEAQMEENVHAKAEKRGLQELMNILLDNAVKYCDEGGKVRMELSSKGKGMQLKVMNDYAAGEGEDYSRFFNRFYRGDQSHSSRKKGYGIGLSMAQTLLETFHGKITVNWKDGVICFTVLIGR